MPLDHLHRAARSYEHKRGSAKARPASLVRDACSDGELPRPQQPDRLVALEQIEQVAQRLAALAGQLRIAREDQLRIVARGRE